MRAFFYVLQNLYNRQKRKITRLKYLYSYTSRTTRSSHSPTPKPKIIAHNIMKLLVQYYTTICEMSILRVLHVLQQIMLYCTSIQFGSLKLSMLCIIIHARYTMRSCSTVLSIELHTVCVCCFTKHSDNGDRNNNYTVY